MESIDFALFSKVEMRVGTVVAAEIFPEARKPALKLTVDFGPEIGLKKTSAQITRLYEPQNLVGRQIIAVVNFPKKQIGPFFSEFLALGAVEKNGTVVLLNVDQKVENGTRIG